MNGLIGNLYFVSPYGDPLLRTWSRVVAYFIRDQWTCLSFLQKFAETPEATEVFQAAVEALSLLPSDLVLPVLDFMHAALPQVTTDHSVFSILWCSQAGECNAIYIVTFLIRMLTVFAHFLYLHISVNIIYNNVIIFSILWCVIKKDRNMIKHCLDTSFFADKNTCLNTWLQ